MECNAPGGVDDKRELSGGGDFIRIRWIDRLRDTGIGEMVNGL